MQRNVTQLRLAVRTINRAWITTDPCVILGSFRGPGVTTEVTRGFSQFLPSYCKIGHESLLSYIFRHCCAELPVSLRHIAYVIEERV